ncbi:MAG TPA: hypothetical protein VLR47_01975 [Rhodospirillales bacterium]|nr:hypothetical protein [Rhodospirillales bacterium]
MTLAAAAATAAARLALPLAPTDDLHSVRSDEALRDFWSMVARTAFTELGHSWYRLVMAVAMMTLLYAVPPVALTAGALFTAMTIDSAWRHVRGRDGMWKGRAFAPPQGSIRS